MKVSLIIITYICLLAFKPPVETDYKRVFGNKYTWAVNWLKQNNSLINEYASAFNIPDKELKAIIFPELIRYNSFFDALEIESLKYLYVKEGKQYADFSVGYFQMKPSFGEMIEEDALNLLPGNYRRESGWKSKQTDGEVSRRERVKRLSNVRHQLIYLCAFYKICEYRFKGKRISSPEERVKLFATCYNAGYRRSYESLLSFLSKNNFYSYNYSSVSAYYYMQK
ncbi:MAG TPA: hypothetical protein VK625_10975 [Flavitalea sp.]|nr:hypothetical protein [Flavitalea sp.]